MPTLESKFQCIAEHPLKFISEGYLYCESGETRRGPKGIGVEQYSIYYAWYLGTDKPADSGWMSSTILPEQDAWVTASHYYSKLAMLREVAALIHAQQARIMEVYRELCEPRAR